MSSLKTFLNHHSLTVEEANRLSDKELMKMEYMGRRVLRELRAQAPVVVVTQHRALVDYLSEIGLIKPEARVIEHATPDQVRGKHVIGVLPLHLAALAVRVTVVPLALPREARSRELTLDEVRRYAGRPRTYIVEEEN